MRMRISVAVASLTALLGCSGASTMPPGFNDACYGGNFTKNLAGAKPEYSATLAIPHSSRPDLRGVLFELAAKHSLKAFDDGANYEALDFFSVYLCSSTGAFVKIDSRAAGEDAVRVDVFTYQGAWRSGPFVADLRAALISRWPDGLRNNDPSDTTLGNSVL
jgi:hypothetical protein